MYNIDGVRILYLFYLFVSLGVDSSKLIKTFTNCINRHNLREKFKTIGHIFSPISTYSNVYKCLCDCK